MNYWKKPVLVNLIIVAVSILCNFLLIRSDRNDLNHVYLPQFFASGLLILLLAPINLIIGMVRNRNRQKDGPVYLILSGMLLLVGFSVCTIN